MLTWSGTHLCLIYEHITIAFLLNEIAFQHILRFDVITVYTIIKSKIILL